MLRYLALSFMALSMTFTACSGSDKKETPPPSEQAPAPMADDQALIGSWSDGSNTFTFNANKSFRWDASRACSAPPCPTSTTSGTYSLRGGKLYLKPSGGTDEVMNFSFASGQNGMSLNSNKRGKNWTLNRAN